MVMVSRQWALRCFSTWDTVGSALPKPEIWNLMYSLSTSFTCWRPILPAQLAQGRIPMLFLKHSNALSPSQWSQASTKRSLTYLLWPPVFCLWLCSKERHCIIKGNLGNQTKQRALYLSERPIRVRTHCWWLIEICRHAWLFRADWPLQHTAKR